MIPLSALFLSLGLDTFAVAVGLGVLGLPRNRWLRLGLTFALFEGAMPAVGLLLGRHLTGLLGNFAAYIAAGLLIVFGGQEIREAVMEKKPPQVSARQERALWATGLSVSMDELAVGFSLGVIHAPVGLALGYIAIQALILTFVGLLLGSRIGGRIGERAELVAGILLVVLGLFLLGEQVMGAGVL
jgi:manganese efflux pump family protein